jgi:hypothetical protein
MEYNFLKKDKEFFMGILNDIKNAYNDGYESTAGIKKDGPAEQPGANATAVQPDADEAADEKIEKRKEINRSIRGIFFSLLFTFLCLLAGIGIFSFFSEKNNTGLMLLGIPVAIFPVIIGFFRDGSIGAVLKESLNAKPEEYLDAEGRRRKRDTGAGFAGMLIQFLILLIAGIFITVIKIVFLLFKWLILAIRSKGRAFISPFNVPLLCIAALVLLLVVLNFTSPGMVSIEF